MTPSEPPGLARRFSYQHTTQIVYRLAETFLSTHVTVLVFDRQDPIVTLAAQHAYERLPKLIAMAITARPKHPGAGGQIAVTLGIESAVDSHVMAVEGGVLGVDMI